MNTGLRTTIAATLLCGLFAPGAVDAQSASTGDYAVSRQSSLVAFTLYAQVIFKVKQEGRFNDFTGAVTYDPAHPADTRVDVTVYTASVDMKNPEHDDLLRSPDFFDVDHFPTMHFVSTGASVRPDGTLAMTGDLTIRGVTKHLVLPVKVEGTARPTPVFDTTFEIDRTEFGLNGTPKWSGVNVSIARNVKIHLSIAGTPPACTARC